MFHEFLDENRAEILARSRARVASRCAPAATARELEHGLPMFMGQLGAVLRGKELSGEHSAIEASASRHGRDLWREGFTVKQVVHDYGAICQSVTELAIEKNVSISTEDFRILNQCLDDAIAEAVGEYGQQRERSVRAEGTERLAVLAHEMRGLLSTAMLAYDSIRAGVVAPNGSTGLALGRSLVRMQSLIDRSFAEVRLDAGIGGIERVSVAELLGEIEISAAMQARVRNIHVAVELGDAAVTVEADHQILMAAIGNLVQNALKFTRKDGKVSLYTTATAERVLIEVEDECGGLPPGKAEDLFQPYLQRGADRTGLGLGLSICLKAVKGFKGELRVRNLPGKGCVFTIDLPKQPPVVPSTS